MPSAPVSAFFRDAATGEELDQLNFQLLPTLPRVGDHVVLPGGQRGQVQAVEWQLARSRFVGVKATVKVDLELDVNIDH